MSDTAQHTHSASTVPTPRAPRLPCPYCGALQSASAAQCEACGGLFEPLSRQASQNAMGPWWIRDEHRVFQPGCSYDTLRRLVRRGKIERDTVIRGPTTRQFWMLAQDAPGVSHLLGLCYACHGEAGSEEYMCRSCGAVFDAPVDRQRLGLAPVRLLPGQAPPEQVAASTLAESSGAWTAVQDSDASGPGASGSEGREEGGVRSTAAVQAVQDAVVQSVQRANEDSLAAANEAILELRAELRQMRSRGRWFAVGLVSAALASTAMAVALLAMLLGR